MFCRKMFKGRTKSSLEKNAVKALLWEPSLEGNYWIFNNKEQGGERVFKLTNLLVLYRALYLTIFIIILYMLKLNVEMQFFCSLKLQTLVKFSLLKVCFLEKEKRKGTRSQINYFLLKIIEQILFVWFKVFLHFYECLNVRIEH